MQSAHAAELTVLLGSPSSQLESVNSIVEKRIELTDKPDVAHTTHVFGVLARKGVETATSVSILNQKGAVNYSLFYAGFKTAMATQSPVVYVPLSSNIEERENAICKVMATMKNTVFVLAEQTVEEPFLQGKIEGARLLKE